MEETLILEAPRLWHFWGDYYCLCFQVFNKILLILAYDYGKPLTRGCCQIPHILTYWVCLIWWTPGLHSAFPEKGGWFSLSLLAWFDISRQDFLGLWNSAVRISDDLPFEYGGVGIKRNCWVEVAENQRKCGVNWNSLRWEGLKWKEQSVEE